MIEAIKGFFSPLILGISTIFFLLKGTVSSIVAVFSWLGTAVDYVLGSANFALDISLLDWLPTPLVGVFMAMVAFSILCCIFGRIRG